MQSVVGRTLVPTSFNKLQTTSQQLFDVILAATKSNTPKFKVTVGLTGFDTSRR